MSENKKDILKENAKDLQGEYTSLTIGEILKRARLQHNVSPEQASADLRIKAVYLNALEKDDYERLPGQAYVNGFVKSYSDYLGLDSQKMLQLLKRRTGARIVRPKQIFPVASEEQKVPGFRIVIISTALFAFVLMFWRLGAAPGPNADAIPAIPKELSQQMTAPQKPAAPPKTEAVAVEEKPKPHPVVLKAVQDVWLEIRDGAGKPVFSRVLKTGEEYWVPADETGYIMTTGNAGGLELVVEGVALKPLGKAGDVRRNVALNPARLKVLLEPKAVPAPQSN